MRIVLGALCIILLNSSTPIVFIYFPCLGFERRFLSQSSTSDSNHKSLLLPGILTGGGMHSGLLLKSTLMVLSVLRMITLSSSMPIIFSMLILYQISVADSLFSDLRLGGVILISRERHFCQNTDNCNHNHYFE